MIGLSHLLLSSLFISALPIPLSVSAAPTSSCLCGFRDPSTEALWTDAIITYFNETSSLSDIIFDPPFSPSWQGHLSPGLTGEGSQPWSVVEYVNDWEDSFGATWRSASRLNNTGIDQRGLSLTVQPADQEQRIVYGAAIVSRRRDVRFGSFRAGIEPPRPGLGGTILRMAAHYNSSSTISSSFLTKDDQPSATLEWDFSSYTRASAPHSQLVNDLVGGWLEREHRFDWSPSSLDWHIDSLNLTTQSWSILRGDKKKETIPPNVAAPLSFVHFSNGEPTQSRGPPLSHPATAHLIYARLFFNSSLPQRQQEFLEQCSTQLDVAPCSTDDLSLRLSTPFDARATQHFLSASQKHSPPLFSIIMTSICGGIFVLLMSHALLQRWIKERRKAQEYAALQAATTAKGEASPTAIDHRSMPSLLHLPYVSVTQDEAAEGQPNLMSINSKSDFETALRKWNDLSLQELVESDPSDDEEDVPSLLTSDDVDADGDEVLDGIATSSAPSRFKFSNSLSSFGHAFAPGSEASIPLYMAPEYRPSPRHTPFASSGPSTPRRAHSPGFTRRSSQTTATDSFTPVAPPLNVLGGRNRLTIAARRGTTTSGIAMPQLAIASSHVGVSDEVQHPVPAATTPSPGQHLDLAPGYAPLNSPTVDPFIHGDAPTNFSSTINLTEYEYSNRSNKPPKHMPEPNEALSPFTEITLAPPALPATRTGDVGAFTPRSASDYYAHQPRSQAPASTVPDRISPGHPSDPSQALDKEGGAGASTLIWDAQIVEWQPRQESPPPSSSQQRRPTTAHNEPRGETEGVGQLAKPMSGKAAEQDMRGAQEQAEREKGGGWFKRLRLRLRARRAAQGAERGAKTTASGAVRVRYLDGLRGFACFAVSLHHFILMFYLGIPTPSSPQHHPRFESAFRHLVGPLLANGGLNIGIFFVLAARVIANRWLVRGRLEDLAEAIMRRVPRLMVPISAAILLSYFLLQLGAFTNVRRLPSRSWSSWAYYEDYDSLGTFINSWIQLWFTTPPATPLMVTTYATGILWTVPLIVSESWTVFIMALVGRHAPDARKRYGFYFACLALTWWANKFSMFFIAGLIVADADNVLKYREKARRGVTILPNLRLSWQLLAWILFLSGASLAWVNYNLPHLFLLSEVEFSLHPDWTSANPHSKQDQTSTFTDPSVIDLFWVMSIFILCDVCVPFRAFFQLRYWEILGRNAFSLYLLHGIVFWSLGATMALSLLKRGLPYWATTLLTFLASYAALLPLCEAFTRTWDRWGISLSRALWRSTSQGLGRKV